MSISSCNSFFCSGFRLATHLALSNFSAGGSGAAAAAEEEEAPLAAAGLGAPKKDVMLALGFDFLLASVAAAAFRFNVDIAVMCVMEND